MESTTNVLFIMQTQKSVKLSVTGRCPQIDVLKHSLILLICGFLHLHFYHAAGGLRRVPLLNLLWSIWTLFGDQLTGARIAVSHICKGAVGTIGRATPAAVHAVPRLVAPLAVKVRGELTFRCPAAEDWCSAWWSGAT